LIRPEAYEVAKQLMEVQRIDPDDPRGVAVPYTVEAWLTKGWKAETIVLAVAGVMAHRDKAPDGLRYFEKAIARAHEPQPIIAKGETYGPDHNRTARPSGRSSGSPPRGAAAIMAVMGERQAIIDERRRQRMATAVSALPAPS
jgi:hypothetical protein